jgi:uncharacterized protein (DUF4415 family)
MKKKGDTVTYSLEEIRARVAAGKDQTDWEKVAAQTEEELEMAIATDPDWKEVSPDWWKNAQLVIPENKKSTTIRVDADVLDWFKKQGKGWQTQINAILRTYYQSHIK